MYIPVCCFFAAGSQVSRYGIVFVLDQKRPTIVCVWFIWCTRRKKRTKQTELFFFVRSKISSKPVFLLRPLVRSYDRAISMVCAGFEELPTNQYGFPSNEICPYVVHV